MSSPRLIALGLVTIFLLDCQDDTGPGGSLSLSWNFADGRNCESAGVLNIVITGTSTHSTVLGCRDGCGEATQEIVVDQLPSNLTVTAQSISGASLYQWSGRVSSLSPAQVHLRFIGGDEGLSSNNED